MMAVPAGQLEHSISAPGFAVPWGQEMDLLGPRDPLPGADVLKADPQWAGSHPASCHKTLIPVEVIFS